MNSIDKLISECKEEIARNLPYNDSLGYIKGQLTQALEDAEDFLSFLERLQKYHQEVVGRVGYLIVSRNIEMPDGEWIPEKMIEVKETIRKIKAVLL